MFKVIHFRQYGSLYEESVLIGIADSLEQAKSMRAVSGDLVCYPNGKLVALKDWLWDWELANPKSYAHAAILKERA